MTNNHEPSASTSAPTYNVSAPLSPDSWARWANLRNGRQVGYVGEDHHGNVEVAVQVTDTGGMRPDTVEYGADDFLYPCPYCGSYSHLSCEAGDR